MSVEEVREYIGADSLGYLSLEGMLQSIGIDSASSCNACWTGKYPTLLANMKSA
jgi:amidophosphoribosyltransferase